MSVRDGTVTNVPRMTRSGTDSRSFVTPLDQT